MTGAYSFICDYSSTDTLCARLNQVGGIGTWETVTGTATTWPPCLFPAYVIRIVDFPGRTETGYRYESDIRIRKECTTPREEIDAAYRKVLAQIPAHDVREIEWFD
ncbi:MAG TPA: hypothetical protein VE176_02610 [Candidatus Limnocylindrales bacterium]|nr:hypothetical protein [Candidatus Limnocylindrales bacterium]